MHVGGGGGGGRLLCPDLNSLNYPLCLSLAIQVCHDITQLTTNKCFHEVYVHVLFKV